VSRLSFSRRELTGVAVFALAIVVVMFLPRFISDFRAQQYAYVGIYLIALIGLNILTGYTGQISLGHGAFMAIGGYTTAILISDQGLKLGSHVFAADMRDIWTIPLAGLVAGTAGFLFGFPALRLTGLYLALATFAVAVATPAVIRKFEHFTGGGAGINIFEVETLTRPRETTDPITFETVREPIRMLGFEITSFNEWLYYLCWTIALALFAVAWFFLRGRVGRALRAVRDSELAAASSGINLATYKTLAFGVSAFYAGVAGALLGIATTFVNPDTFPITLSIFLLVGVVVGGLGSLWPLVVGAVFIQFLPLWAQSLNDYLPSGLGPLDVPNFRAPGAPSVVYGVILILVMLALPGGAAGLARRIAAGARRRLART
jgi:branched-chain amino acid transport system permease protein